MPPNCPPIQAESFFLRMPYFFVLLASFVSVSLYVSIAFCKFVQAWFTPSLLLGPPPDPPPPPPPPPP